MSSNIVIKAFKFIWWNLVPDQYFLKHQLLNFTWHPIKQPRCPSVSEDTRLKLEQAFNSASNAYPLSSNNYNDYRYQDELVEISKLFKTIISTTIKNTIFDLTKVRGCAASKSFSDRHYMANSKYNTVDEWGVTLGSLPRLIDKTEDEQIKICKSHPQCRFSDEICVSYDEWHGYYY